jgi:hypothetical protein
MCGIRKPSGLCSNKVRAGSTISYLRSIAGGMEGTAFRSATHDAENLQPGVLKFQTGGKTVSPRFRMPTTLVGAHNSRPCDDV